MTTDRDWQGERLARDHADRYWSAEDGNLWNVAHSAFLDGYRAALRIAAERRKQEKPVAYRSKNQCLYAGLWDYSDEFGDPIPPDAQMLILRDPEEQQ